MIDAELRTLERLAPSDPVARERLIWWRDKLSPPRLWLAHSTPRVHLVSPAPRDFNRRLALDEVTAQGFSTFPVASPLARCGTVRGEYNALPGFEVNSMQWVPWRDEHPRSCKTCAKLRLKPVSDRASDPTMWQWQVACSALLLDSPCPDPRAEEIEDALKIVKHRVEELKRLRDAGISW